MRLSRIAMVGLVGGLFALAVPAAVSAGKPVHQLPASYQAAYCYPTGTYWQKQLSNFNNVDYYNQYNSYYQSHYGAGSAYCPS